MSKKNIRRQRFLDRTLPLLTKQELMNANFAVRRKENTPKKGHPRLAYACVHTAAKLGKII